MSQNSDSPPKLPPQQETEKKTANARHPIRVAVQEFVHEIGSLAATLPLVMLVVESSASSHREEFVRYAREKCTDVKEGGGNISVKVPIDVYHEYWNKKRKVVTLQLARKTVPRSFLTSLVSHYDAFLGALLRASFYLKPELLNGSERSLTFKELTAFSSLDDAREFLVEREVETVIRNSHGDQFA